MITVTAPLWLWSEGQGSTRKRTVPQTVRPGRWHFLTIPADQAVEIRLESAASGVRRGFGSVRVEARIADVSWRTSIFPQKAGGYLLPVKSEVRKRAGIAAGDEVTVAIVPLA